MTGMLLAAASVGLVVLGWMARPTAAPPRVTGDLAAKVVAARNVYRRAADLLADRGLCKGDLAGPGGTLDMLGACLVADGFTIDAGRPSDLVDAVVRHSRFLGQFLGPDEFFPACPVMSIADWTDRRDRTVDDCIRLLRQAADLRERQLLAHLTGTTDGVAAA